MGLILLGAQGEDCPGSWARPGWAVSLPPTQSLARQVAPGSESLWAGENSPVIYLQEGEVCLGCDLPLLILRGVGVLK